MHGHEWDDERVLRDGDPVAPATVWRPALAGGAPSMPVFAAAAPARSPGLAVLLTFLWLGAGNLYAGQVGLGVTLAVVQLVCLPLAGLFASVTLGVSLLVSVPVWLTAVAVAGASAHARCRDLGPAVLLS